MYQNVPAKGGWVESSITPACKEPMLKLSKTQVTKPSLVKPQTAKEDSYGLRHEEMLTDKVIPPEEM